MGSRTRFSPTLAHSGKSPYKIAPSGDVVGEYNIGTKGEDSWLLPDGHILGSHNGGVREIDPASGAVVWEYKAGPGVEEVHPSQPLPDSKVLICECGSKRLSETQPRYEQLHRRSSWNRPSRAHKQFRLGGERPTPELILVAYGSDAVVRGFGFHGQSFAKLRRSSGEKPRRQWRISSAQRQYTHHGRIWRAEVALEFDHDAKIIWTLKQADLPAGFNLHYMGTAQRLPNGNTVLSNFQGVPDVFEVTPDKKVVWQYCNEKNRAGVGVSDCGWQSIKSGRAARESGVRYAAGTIEAAPTASMLDYGRAEPRRRRWIRRSVWFAVIVAIGLATWRFEPPISRHLRLLYCQWQCMNYSAPEDQVVFESNPAKITRLLSEGKNYIGATHPNKVQPPKRLCLHFLDRASINRSNLFQRLLADSVFARAK